VGQNDRIRTVRVRTLILNIGHTAILRSAVLLLASLAWEGTPSVMSTRAPLLASLAALC
jgi:hypothetical protein